MTSLKQVKRELGAERGEGTEEKQNRGATREDPRGEGREDVQLKNGEEPVGGEEREERRINGEVEKYSERWQNTAKDEDTAITKSARSQSI